MHQEDKGRPQRPAESERTPGAQRGPMSPGDQAPAGTPGTGENVCPVCGGEGSVEGRPCANCGGTGVVIEGVGGA